jgi:uncharacterized Zn-finger protein
MKKAEPFADQHGKSLDIYVPPEINFWLNPTIKIRLKDSQDLPRHIRNIVYIHHGDKFSEIKEPYIYEYCGTESDRTEVQVIVLITSSIRS